MEKAAEPTLRADICLGVNVSVSFKLTHIYAKKK